MTPNININKYNTDVLYWVKYFLGAVISTSIMTIGIQQNIKFITATGFCLVAGWAIYNIVTYEEQQ